MTFSEEQSKIPLLLFRSISPHYYLFLGFNRWTFSLSAVLSDMLVCRGAVFSREESPV